MGTRDRKIYVCPKCDKLLHHPETGENEICMIDPDTKEFYCPPCGTTLRHKDCYHIRNKR